MTQTAKIEQSLYEEREKTAYRILIIMGLCHLLNDTIQSVVPAMFPILEKSMNLSYTQLGLIAFSLNIVASILQPVFGSITDKKPFPFALPIGLTLSLFGVLGLAFAPKFEFILLSVIFIGLGSAVFHPEGSRVAFLGAGPRRGLAQSIYQVGGNTGQALAPLITALILVPLGQKGAAWFTIVAGMAVCLLIYIANWYNSKIKLQPVIKKGNAKTLKEKGLPKAVYIALLLILFLIFARSWYISGITNYYAFYAIDKYSMSIRESQILLFAFLVAGAGGTFFGGPLSDRFGKKNIIFISLLGSAPFSILIPFMPLSVAYIMLVVSGFILMLSFSVTVVYAQELVPGKIGTMAGLTVGLAFGMGAIGSVGLGSLADSIGLTKTIIMTGFLPLLGITTLFLPSDQKLREINR